MKRKVYLILFVMLTVVMGFSMTLCTKEVQAKQKKWQKAYTKFLKKKDIGIVSYRTNAKKAPILVGKKITKKGNYQITFYKYINGKVKKVGSYKTQYDSDQVEVYETKSKNKYLIYDGQGSSIYTYIEMRLKGKKMKKTVWSLQEIRDGKGNIVTTYYKNGKLTNWKKYNKAIKYTYSLEFYRPEW